MKKFFGSYGIAFVLAIIAGVLKKDGVEAAYNILFTASFMSVVYLEVKKEEGFLRKFVAFFISGILSSMIFYFIAERISSHL